MNIISEFYCFYSLNSYVNFKFYINILLNTQIKGMGKRELLKLF